MGNPRCTYSVVEDCIHQYSKYGSIWNLIVYTLNLQLYTWPFHVTIRYSMVILGYFKSILIQTLHFHEQNISQGTIQSSKWTSIHIVGASGVVSPEFFQPHNCTISSNFRVKWIINNQNECNSVSSSRQKTLKTVAHVANILFSFENRTTLLS